MHKHTQHPRFCHDLDCPRYKVLSNLTDIGVELREYEAGERCTLQHTAARRAGQATHAALSHACACTLS